MAGARHGMCELTARHGHGMLCVNRPLDHHEDFAGKAERREDASGGAAAWYVAMYPNRVAAGRGVLNYKLDKNKTEEVKTWQ
jgi:hypothetical protein